MISGTHDVWSTSQHLDGDICMPPSSVCKCKATAMQIGKSLKHAHHVVTQKSAAVCCRHSDSITVIHTIAEQGLRSSESCKLCAHCFLKRLCGQGCLQHPFPLLLRVRGKPPPPRTAPQHLTEHALIRKVQPSVSGTPQCFGNDLF